jgi:predicted metalloprotease
MEINQNASVDASQIDDARGSGGGGGLGGRLGSIPIPTSKGGLIVTVIAVLLALAGGGFGINQLSGGGGDPGNSIATGCATGTAAHDETDCRNALYVESIQSFWKTELPDVYGKTYEPSQTEFFSGQTDTGCGAADSGVGPFYCPEDDKVYIDLSFYNELSTKFGAKGAFAQPYVLAHEYGHHVQDLLGTTSDNSVDIELQADCFAGVWAKHATETKDQKGQPIFTKINDADIKEALDAAAAVGDDAIQKKMGGQVDESKFTHGSSAQRDQWFNTGYSSGDPKKCDTFS